MLQRYTFNLDNPNIFREICLKDRDFNTKRSNCHKTLIAALSFYFNERFNPWNDGSACEKIVSEVFSET